MDVWMIRINPSDEAFRAFVQGAVFEGPGRSDLFGILHGVIG